MVLPIGDARGVGSPGWSAKQGPQRGATGAGGDGRANDAALRGTRVKRGRPSRRSAIPSGAPIRLPPCACSFVAAILLVAACEAGRPPATPADRPGTPDAPREVNLIARGLRVPAATLDLAPGRDGPAPRRSTAAWSSTRRSSATTASRMRGRPPRQAARRPAARPDAGRQRAAGRGRRPRSSSRRASGSTCRLDGPGGPRPRCVDRRAATSPGTGSKGMQIPVRWVGPNRSPGATGEAPAS